MKPFVDMIASGESSHGNSSTSSLSSDPIAQWLQQHHAKQRQHALSAGFRGPSARQESRACAPASEVVTHGRAPTSARAKEPPSTPHECGAAAALAQEPMRSESDRLPLPQRDSLWQHAPTSGPALLGAALSSDSFAREEARLHSPSQVRLPVGVPLVCVRLAGPGEYGIQPAPRAVADLPHSAHGPPRTAPGLWARDGAPAPSDPSAGGAPPATGVVFDSLQLAADLRKLSLSSQSLSRASTLTSPTLADSDALDSTLEASSVASSELAAGDCSSASGSLRGSLQGWQAGAVARGGFSGPQDVPPEVGSHGLRASQSLRSLASFRAPCHTLSSCLPLPFSPAGSAAGSACSDDDSSATDNRTYAPGHRDSKTPPKRASQQATASLSRRQQQQQQQQEEAEQQNQQHQQHHQQQQQQLLLHQQHQKWLQQQKRQQQHQSLLHQQHEQWLQQQRRQEGRRRSEAFGLAEAILSDAAVPAFVQGGLQAEGAPGEGSGRSSGSGRSISSGRSSCSGGGRKAVAVAKVVKGANPAAVEAYLKLKARQNSEVAWKK